MRFVFSVVALAGLAACGDPLADVERFADLHISEETRIAALPSEEELARDRALIEVLLSEVPAEAEEVASDLPEETTELPDDVKPAAEAAEKTEETDRPRRGLFSWLKRTGSEATEEANETEFASLTPTEAVEGSEAVEEAALSEAKAKVAKDVKDDVAKAEPVPETETQLASLEPASEPKAEPRRKPRRSGRQTKAGVPDVAFGTVLPFGEVGRVCEARAKPLGKRVERSETRGEVYALFDTAPGSAAPRTFYVTGFADACPRQFTAALAMFGAPSMHEQLRYGRPSVDIPYSETDAAYEKVKHSICRVPMSKPCGKRMDLLERSTVFISMYERFTNNGRWADVLIHKSSVVATAMKNP